MNKAEDTVDWESGRGGGSVSYGRWRHAPESVVTDLSLSGPAEHFAP